MTDLLQTRRGTAVVITATALLFLLPRLALLYVRDPFYDELFTLWIAPKPFAAILEALRHDSGPPLYYFVVHALGLRSIEALRIFSLVCACAAAAMLLASRWLGPARFAAVFLLAVYPPAALFAVDARAYALCALFLTAGVLALDRHLSGAATVSFVLAAYTHFYGVLFFPLLLIPAVYPRTRFPPFLAAGAAVLFFLPGFYLASIQPKEALGWLAASQQDASILAPVANASFAARYPASLFAPAPVVLTVVALVLLAIAVARSARFAAAVGVPLAAVIAFGLARRGVYFPMRFEALTAVALMLWIASSLQRWNAMARRLIAAGLLVIGVWSIAMGVMDHLRRPLDAYREGALSLRRVVRADEIVVAAGYCYLEALTHAGTSVIPFAPQQGEHPGWRHPTTVEEAIRLAESRLPRATFLFIGETRSPELTALRRKRHLELLFVNQHVVVARVHSQS